MILVLDNNAGPEQVGAVLRRMGELGLEGRELHWNERTFVHVTAGSTPVARRLLKERLVLGLVPTSGPRVRREGRRFHPYHTLRLSSWLTLLVGAWIAVAGFFPPGAGERLLPGQDVPAVDAWPWYSLPFRAVLHLLPHDLGPLVLVGIGALILGLPFLDRSRGPELRRRAPVLVAGLVAVVLIVVALMLGGRS